MSTIDAVMNEYCRAKGRYPTWPVDPVHAAAVVAEESGELVQAVNDLYFHGRGDIESIRTEAIQTAAMCLRFLERLENYKWGGGELV